MMKNNPTTAKVSEQQIRALFQREDLLFSPNQHEDPIKEIRNIYWYEKQLIIAIPLLISSANTLELVESLTVLLKCTKAHIKKLEKKYPGIGQIPKG
ncbi:MAG: DUF892 family protein [Flavobacterium sp. JAD_PAG50586_2]|nr:MAG: DUF892 family protein [Flavobacterium sp. JAD_PAG50586_2]